MPESQTHKQEETSLTTAGQRKINKIWEVNQAVIALLVVGITLTVDAVLALTFKAISNNQFSAMMQLNVMAGLVIGFYFGRTNHTKASGGGMAGKSAAER